MDVFDLVAKIRLDSSEYEQGVGKAKGTFSTLASGVKTGLATVAKVGAAAVTAGVAGVAALTKMGVEGYAQYEQLVGGVETLFKDSQGAVMKYAENAYKTAGMSANQYMETVTSFSASLIQSLDGDTAKAANVADMAITDMSDNANKMGTSIEMIQNAYNGFAKGNFTMLDNLKLGYGGTKTEMERLIKDANKVKQANGEMADLSIDSFADVSEAIHIMQTEMGITGTTAREASSTIEGSIGMMKGAWQNLVVGMADSNADMTVLINNFVESTATAAKNLLPRIEQTLKGIGDLITAMAPIISKALPVLVKSVLPSLLTAGVSLVTAIVEGVVTALPALYKALLEGVKIILVEVFGVSEEKAGDFADSVNSFFVKIKDGFLALVKSAQTDGTILNRIWEGLKTAFEVVKEALTIAFKAVSAAFKWCAEQINTEGTWLNKTWTGIQDAVHALLDFVSACFDALKTAFEWCVEQINAHAETLKGIWENIKSFISAAIDVIQNVINLFISVLKGDWSSAWDAIKGIVSSVWDAIKSIVSAAIDIVSTIISTVMAAIKNVMSNIWEGIKGIVSNALDDVKSAISEKFEAAKAKVTEIFDSIKEKISTAWNAISSTVSNVLNTIKNTVSNIWNGIKSTISSVIDGVKSSISSGLNGALSTVSTVLGNIKSKFSSIFDNCKSIVTNAIAAVKKAFNFSWSLPGLKLPRISVSGGVAPYGIGGRGSLPRFSIAWYKKAYDNAMILSKPTIFGYSAASGKFLGGGDGNGNEIVAGESHLMGMIGHVVESKTAAQNERIVALLSALLEATVDGNTETVRALMSDRTFAVGEREFARLVRNYA